MKGGEGDLIPPIFGVWGFAAESSVNPRDYITSLLSVDSAKTILVEGEDLRLLAHGYEGGENIDLQGEEVSVESKLDEIKATYKKRFDKDAEDEQVIPIQCFLGDEGSTLDRIGKNKKGLGSGPVLIPISGVVSIDGLLDDADWNGNDFIDSEGRWKDASAVLSALPKLKAYKDSEAGCGGEDQLLASALEEVFTEIKTGYEAFTVACEQTGKAPSPWPNLPA